VVADRTVPNPDRSPAAAPDDVPARDDAFERAMADVVRIAPDPRGRARAASPIPLLRPAEELAASPLDAVPDDFVAPGVDRRELRKLRRGAYPVDARLDLHGLPANKASATVDRFIENSRHGQNRCVCIVHGRGLNSPGGVPVLRGRVRERLTRNPAVLAFVSAPAADGGDGAVYVLLRRRSSGKRPNQHER
jgi:DNA-nicking Smr family endonuclease